MPSSQPHPPLVSFETLSALVDRLQVPVFVKDGELRYVLVNDAYSALVGVAAPELIGRTDGELHQGSEIDDVGEQTFIDPCGRARTFSIRRTRLQDATGEPWILGELRDITERQQALQSFLHLAFHDRLTGLGNRTLFGEQLRHEVAEARRQGTALAVLSLNLDRFGIVNDTLGFAAGDQLLRAVTQRLQSVFRADDPVARLSGDEFACLVRGCDTVQTAERIADRVHEALRQPFDVVGAPLELTASVGIAWSPGEQSSEDLLRFANVALHRAQRKGGGGTQVFDMGIDAAATERLHAQNELQRALAEGQLTLYFQPLMDLATGRLTGAEALVRWLHPQRGLIPPDQFIPLAEESGLIVPLGEWVLEQVCRQAMRWKRQLGLGPDLTWCVNISARQLRDDRLISRLREILNATGLPAEQLVLELTENTLLHDKARARELRDLSVRLAIDDFGTGYASLSYLRDLPVDILKVARPFVSKLGRERVDSRLVSTILSLVQDLGLVSVAEGIEEAHQAQLLQQMGCNIGQGFLWAKPLPAIEFERFLRRGPVAEDETLNLLARPEPVLLKTA